MSQTLEAEIIEVSKKRGKYGEGSCYQRSDNARWEISFYDNEGRRRRESFSTEAKARKALTRRLVLKDAGKLDAPEGRTKTDSLAESYKLYAKNSAPKSYWWIELVWRVHLEPFFGGRVATRVTTDQIEQYRAERLATGVKSSTVNREATVLRAIFRHALKFDKISRIPRFPDKLAEPNPRTGFLTHKQYEALQLACRHAWLKALMAVAYNFGFRKSELLGLRVSQVDLKTQTIQLLPGETKSGEGRTVVMTADVHPLLAECVKGKESDDLVFTWKDGRPVKDFRGTWSTLCESAKISVLLHDFRRTAVRNLIRAGVSRDVARRISGHETDSIFSRYNITEENDLADAARKLEISRKLATESAE
jgi:integrase